MAFVQLEDANSKAEIVAFPKLFKKIESWLKNYNVFIVRGFLETMSQRFCKIKANDMVPLELFFQEWPTIQEVSLFFPMSFDKELLISLQTTFLDGKIPLSLIIHEQGKYLRVQTKRKISLDLDKIIALEKEYGIQVKLRI